MDRNVTAFRKRFNAYKNGKSISEIYDAGLPKYVDGTSGLSPDETFVASMGPLLYRELLYQGVENPDSVYNNLITQLGYESDRGRSRVAREQHNYGGVGWNGKRYFSYKNDADFVHDYVKLMNRRYKSAILAKTLSEYAAGIKKLGYFEDTLENYSRNLIGMKSLAKAVAKHKAANPDLYKIDIQRPVSEPITNPVDNTKVVNTIPAEQTYTTWEGAKNVSPYLTGKPPLILNPPTKLPSVTDHPVQYNSWFENRKSNNIKKMMDNTLSLLFNDEDSDDLLYAKDGRLPKFDNGTKPKSRRARAMYNSIDPRSAYPEGYLDAAKMEAAVRAKMMFGDPDKLEYELGDDMGSRVSDAAWRKRLGYDYDEKLLIPNGDKFRLPVDLENEIPTDTTMLKNRIKRTEELMKYSRKYRSNPYIKLAKLVDLEALEALRKTYKTGQPVTINEHAFNSRLWVSGGNVSPTMSPLNVLLNYTILYDKDTNSILYNDIYDFNLYDWAIPGSPFKIGGQIKVPQYKDGKSPIHIKPANRGKLTRLKARTGKSESELYNDGNPAHKKMVVFARSSRKWHKG